MAIGELEPFAEIFETQQSVMAERICTIVSDSTKLGMLFSENCRYRQEGKRTAETLAMDYHRGAGVEVTSKFNSSGVIVECRLATLMCAFG